MHPITILKNLALILLLALTASSVVSAKTASGPQNLGPGPLQGQSLFNALPCLEKSEYSTTVAPGCSVVAKGAGQFSKYEDITVAGSRYANRATDVTKDQFEKNLLDSGFTRSLSKDGKAINLEKDGMRYSLRDGAKSTGGPTADFYKPGSKTPDLKIRLGE